MGLVNDADLWIGIGCLVIGIVLIVIGVRGMRGR